MKTVAVVGDSFMRPDPRCPGQHFSEMLAPWQVSCYAEDGSSNTLIALQLFQALRSSPDAVILGFTLMDRLEFDVTDAMKRPHMRWVTNVRAPADAKDVQDTMTLYRATASHDMMFVRSLLMVRACLMTLVNQGTAFAYCLNGLWQHPQNNRQHWQQLIIGDFADREITKNFTFYPHLKFGTPCYHVDDIDWQREFAGQCRDILERQ